MSEIIERVARALSPDDFPAENDEERCWCVFCRADLAITQEFQRQKARAAIAAMRQPTESMREAGACYIGSTDIHFAWQAMIDKALEEDAT